MKQTWKQKLVAFWWSWGWSLLVAILIATSFRSAIADWNDVPTGSMKPTILEGDRIFVNKLAYDLKVPYTTWHLAEWDDPQRGDIVVFFSPKDGKRLVKRVVGLPGDEIALWRNQLLLNGEPVEYEPLDQTFVDTWAAELEAAYLFFSEQLSATAQHPVMLSRERPSLHTFLPLKIPDDQYFMMGDNRDNSADSRFFGFVERRQIVGRATAVAFSLDYDNYFIPRWNRFGYKLP